MKKVKVEDLIGPELDYAVCLFLGEKYRSTVFYNSIGMDFPATLYSEDWSLGGPVIQSRGVSIYENLPAMKDSVWMARPSITAKGSMPARACGGPTMLIAGLRCVVSSMFEDYVEIPEKL